MRKEVRRPRFGFFLGVTWLFMPAIGNCQAASSVPAESPELTVLKNKAAMATAEAEIAKAKAEIYKAKLGELSADLLPKGAIEAKTMTIEGQIRGYAAVEETVKKIAAEISGKMGSDTSLIIFSGGELQPIIQYRSFIEVSKLLIERSAELTAKVAMVQSCGTAGRVVDKAMTAPLAAIGTALSVLGLFNSDQVFEGSSVDVDTFALSTLLMKHLTKPAGLRVIYPPAYYSVNTLNYGTDAAGFYLSSALRTYQSLLDRVGLLSESLAEYERVKKYVEENAKAPDACKRAVARHSADAAAAKQYQASLQEATQNLLKADGTTGRALITTYMLSEALATQAQGAYFLQVTSIAAGGTTHTKKSAFSSSIYVGGGSIISYLLMDTNGSPILYDTIRIQAEFVKLDKLGEASKLHRQRK